MTELRPIDRILALAVEKGFSRNGEPNMRALARAAEIDSTTLVKARGSEGGRMTQQVYESLAKVLESTVGFFIGEAPQTSEPSTPIGSVLLPWSKLEPWEKNPRKTFPAEAGDELAESISEKGVLQNLVARPHPSGNGMFQIGAGERRWRAIGKLVAEGRWDADGPSVPVKVVDEPDDDEFKATALAENRQRHDIDPIEEAEGFADLKAENPEKWTNAFIAKRIGASKRHVEQRLALVERLEPSVLQAVRDGLVNFTQARFLTMAPAAKQIELVRHIERYRTSEQLRDAITAGMVPVSRAIFDAEAYSGEISTNDVTGMRYFAVKEEFLTAQKAAALDLVEKLKTEWSWATFSEGYSAPLWDLDKGTPSETRGAPTRITYAFSEEDRDRAGVIVHFDPHLGAVVVYSGLLTKRPVQADPQAEAARVAEHQAWVKEQENHRAVVTSFANELQNALRSDPKGALRLLLIYPALPFQHSVPFDPAQIEGIHKDSVNGGCFRFLGGFVGPADEAGIQTLKPDADPIAAWKAALSISDSHAAEAMASMVAGSLIFDLHNEAHPFITALANHYGVEVPTEIRGEAAKLEA